MVKRITIKSKGLKPKGDRLRLVWNKTSTPETYFSTLAPWVSRISATLSCPSVQAKCKAVLPFWFVMLRILGFCFSSSLSTVSILPYLKRAIRDDVIAILSFTLSLWRIYCISRNSMSLSLSLSFYLCLCLSPFLVQCLSVSAILTLSLSVSVTKQGYHMRSQNIRRSFSWDSLVDRRSKHKATMMFKLLLRASKNSSDKKTLT